MSIELQWSKSSYSGSRNADCVEVATTPATVRIRNSKTPDGLILSVSSVSGNTVLGQSAG